MSEQTSTPNLTGQFAEALVYAELKHHNQVRKGSDTDKEPKPRWLERKLIVDGASPPSR